MKLRDNGAFSLDRLEGVIKKIQESRDQEDRRTKHGLPSDRIRFLANESFPPNGQVDLVQAIIDYLDEEYETKD